MPDYDAGRFSGTFAERNGKEIWEFLNSIESIIRMETATYLSRPAVEPLSPSLLVEFGPAIREDRIKQMIGHMARQIMEARGFQVDRSNVRTSTADNMFTSATRYRASATGAAS